MHQVQPAAISITNATEYGLVYRAAEVAALGEVAKQRGLAFHMDGARLANALVTTGESPADVTWRAGVDALSFGFVKNGGLNAECPDPVQDRACRRDCGSPQARRASVVARAGCSRRRSSRMLEEDLWLDECARRERRRAGACQGCAASG